jgi:hypothetical protein
MKSSNHFQPVFQLQVELERNDNNQQSSWVWVEYRVYVPISDPLHCDIMPHHNNHNYKKNWIISNVSHIIPPMIWSGPSPPFRYPLAYSEHFLTQDCVAGWHRIEVPEWLLGTLRPNNAFISLMRFSPVKCESKYFHLIAFISLFFYLTWKQQASNQSLLIKC